MAEIFNPETTSNLGQSISSITQAVDNNFAALIPLLNDTLSRSGQAPNTLSQSLDVNSNRILNIPSPASPTDVVRLQDLSSLLISTGKVSAIVGGGTPVTGIPTNNIIANIGGFTGNSGIYASGGSLGTIASPTSMWVASGASVMTAPRIFVGAAAAANTGNYNSIAPLNNDWLSKLYTGLPYTNLAQLASFSTIGGIGGLFATRGSDSNSTVHSPQDQLCGVALVALAYNDNTTGTNRECEALYCEAVRAVPQALISFTAEMDTVNLTGTPVNMNPYTPLDFSVPIDVVLGLAAGGSRTGAVNSSAAVVVTGNGASFLNGIEFLVGSVVADSIGVSEAIAMPTGYGFRWWDSVTQPTGFITSTQTTDQSGITLSNSGTIIGNTTDATSKTTAGLIGSGGAAFAKSMFIGGPILSVNASSPLTSAGYSFITANGSTGSGFSMQAAGAEQSRFQTFVGGLSIFTFGSNVIQLEAGAVLGLQVYPSGGVVVGTTAPADPGASNFTALGAITGSNIYSNNATFLIRSLTTLTNSAGATTPTLGTTGPTGATVPTKWFAIDDNGTTRHIPAW